MADGFTCLGVLWVWLMASLLYGFCFGLGLLLFRVSLGLAYVFASLGFLLASAWGFTCLNRVFLWLRFFRASVSLGIFWFRLRV